MTNGIEGDEDAAKLAAAIRALLHQLTVRAQDTSGDGRSSFSGTELSMLGYLLEHPGTMAREVGAFVGLTPTTVQSILDRFVAKGLVSRSPHASDRRAVALSLTNQGQEAIERIRQQDLINCQAMLESLPEDRRSGFASDMALIAETTAGGSRWVTNGI